PYLGFVGDWNAEPIIDHPNTSDQPSVLNDLFGQAHPHQTLLAGFLGSGVQETPWFSPNGDGLLDELFPLYMMLRSAHEMEFEILKGDTVVRTLGTRRDQLRFTLADVADTPFSAAHGSVDHFWDGTLHNPNTGAFEPVPDAGIGTYTFRIKARLSEDFDWQITDLPIGIDTVAPSVSHTVATQPDGSRVYTILANDADSGIAGPRSVIAHDSASPSYFEVTEPTPNSYTFTVPAEMAESDNYVTIFVLDNAGNLVELRDFYQARPIRVLNSHRFDRWIGNSSAPTWIPEVIDGNAVVDLLLSPEVARVEWAGQPVAITDGKARVLIPVKPGRTDFELVAFAADGRELGRASHWLGYDENPPTLEITSAPLNDRGEFVPGPDNTVTISGRVSDDLSTPDDLSVFDDLEEVPLDSEGRFTHTFSLNGETLELAALDHANQQREKDNWANTTVKTFLIEGRSDPHLTYIEFDEPNMNTDDPFGPGLVVVHPKFQNLEVVNPDAGPGELAARLRLTGKLVEQLTSFQVAGQEVELDADQRFSIPIDLVGGINHVGYVAVDRDGKRIEGSWRFIYDRSLPGLDLKVDPRIHPDGAIYLTKQPTDVTFSGEVWDNEFGYRLSLNGNMVKEFQTPWDPGDHNRRPFTSTVPGMRDGQTISLQLQDRLGNGVERQIPVVLDDIDPTVSIDGPSGLVTRDAEFKVTAGDENLEKVSVLLDGKPVALEVVAAGTRPGAKYTERRQGEVVATSPEGSPSATTAQLTLRLKDLPDLASGRHTLSAVALDKAGNQNVTTRLLRVDEPPAVTGPDSLVVEAGKDPRVAIREAYQATDPEDGAVELIFDATRLVPGRATELELSAIDSAGNTTRRTVTITLKVGLPDTQVPPGAPGGGEPQQPTKPIPPARRPGLPKTGG
ncbi:MAG: hypothetical protein Q4D96_09785, partial [Propionibacteriaceae bacterium]|nr:hypothetical protein [Propionibacteriaceae bacterium]